MQHALGLLVEHPGEGIVAPPRLFPVAFGQLLLPPLGRAHLVDGQVGCDAADPGSEGPAEVEGRQSLPRAQEGFLGHVVGHVVSSHDAQGHRVDPSLVALHHLFERKEVAPQGLPEEAGFRKIDGRRRQREASSPKRYARARRLIPGRAIGCEEEGRRAEALSPDPPGCPERPYSRTLITTRRFCARPSFDLLSATGFVSP